MNTRTDSGLVGVGIYSIPQAARLASVPASAIRRWLYGYRYEYDGHEVERPPVFVPNTDLRTLHVLTFLDLIEIQFVHAFRDAGVSWKTLRAAVPKARVITQSDHPFASRAFVTDGRTIFAEIAQRTGSRELLDLKNDQMAFRRVLLPSLRAKLELGDSVIERLWPMGKNRPVVIDPLRQFGQPIVSEEGVPTAVLGRAYDAMKSYDAVARWYDVGKSAVRAAVAYEQRLVA